MAKPKKMTRKELRKPDEVQVALGRTMNLLRKHALKLVIAIVALVAIVIAIRVLSGYMSSKKQAMAGEFNEAFLISTAAIGEEPVADSAEETNGPKKPPMFKSSKEKYQTMASLLEKFAAAHDGDDMADLARLSTVSAKLQLADVQGATATVNAYAESHPRSPIASVVAETQGQLLAQNGRIEEAERYFAQASEGGTVFQKARIEGMRGDECNPAIGNSKAAYKDAAKARKRYEQALKMMTANDRQLPALERFLKNELERKLAFLN